MGKESKIEKERNQILTIFFSTLKLSACTFGGGFVIVPLLKKKFVDELKWITEEEMMDITAIAQSSPGAIAVNAAILIGYKIKGIIGALVATLGTIIPPVLIISLVFYFYQQFRSNPYVNVALMGMLAAVGAVILDVSINMLITIFKDKKIIPIFIFIGAFIATFVFNVNVIYILLVCIGIGIIETSILYYQKKKKEKQTKEEEK